MSSEDHLEQDRSAPSGNDELPTYDDLAAQNGPNSRFGRWRGWIEKRAAERYADITPGERARRKERGWGNEETHVGEISLAVPGVAASEVTVSPPSLSGLHIQTSDLPNNFDPFTSESPPFPPLPFVGRRLSPSHLKINQFGSRFLPHSTAPIRCLLPLDSEKLLLIGHDEGLSVLDVFPWERSESGGITMKGPDEARSRPIWTGESVFQMSLLEVENVGSSTLQGVVLVLIGAEPDAQGSKDTDSMRSLRMYNLESLIKLARWAISQKTGFSPLDLHRPSNWQVQQSPSKRLRSSNIARNLMTLIDVPPSSHLQDPFNSSHEHPFPSSPSLALKSPSLMHAPSMRSPTSAFIPNRVAWDETSWDVINDLPLRWATDFVPFATAGSRLGNTSVLSYALWSDEYRKGKGGQLLAVATKNNILLYETPKGERSFRFVKEFYTPLQPRSLTFFQQFVQSTNRTSTDTNLTHRRTMSSNTTRDAPRASPAVKYGTYISLFVVFDKKAGWIRILDSAVGEIELYDPGAGQQLQHQRSGDSQNTPFILRGRMSLDAAHSSKWIPLARCKIPESSSPGIGNEVHLITRGKQTHIVPCPLPVGALPPFPLYIVTWHSTPRSISARFYDDSSTKDGHHSAAFLQLVALGEDGVEVQEVSVSSLGKGKGRAQYDQETVRAEEDLGGDTGFLCTGGHWDWSQFHPPSLNHSSSASGVSSYSTDSTETDVLMEEMSKEEGLYAWCRKGAQDWRVFWVGGSLRGSNDDEDTDHESDNPI